MKKPTQARYTFADCNGNPVLRECGEPYTGLGPRHSLLLAQELTEILGFRVYWVDNRKGQTEA